MIDGDFESWVLASGKQILYTVNSMHRDLRQSYLWGSYQKGAAYAMSYEDMCAVVTSRLGPSDKERYRIAIAAGQDTPSAKAPTKPERTDHDLVFAFAAAAELAWTLTWGVIRLCGILLIFPFVIRWFNKRK